MSPPVFFFADAAAVEVGAAVELGGAEGRHAADVRRLRTAEVVVLTDGHGVGLHCTVTQVRRGSLGLSVGSRSVVPAPAPRLVVAQALARGGRDDDAVEAMTEVGVDEVIGWTAQRCVAKWTDRTPSKWTSSAHAAARQSRRLWWPSIHGPMTTAALGSRCASADLAVVLHESASEPLASLDVPTAGEVVVVVGPEGGVTDDELDVLSAAGCRAVRLGDTVLRSSTAGVAALSVVCAATRWGPRGAVPRS